jgi:hypothetical protein
MEYKHVFFFEDNPTTFYHENFVEKFKNCTLNLKDVKNELEIYDGIVMPPDNENSHWNITEHAKKLFTYLFQSTTNATTSIESTFEEPMIEAMCYELDDNTTKLNLICYLSKIYEDILLRSKERSQKYDKCSMWNVIYFNCKNKLFIKTQNY